MRIRKVGGWYLEVGQGSEGNGQEGKEVKREWKEKEKRNWKEEERIGEERREGGERRGWKKG